MHIIVAPNAFKGSLSAANAAQCIGEGLNQSNLPCTLTFFPIADGGDDITSLLIQGMHGEIIPVQVHNPLGSIITAGFGWIAAERKAIIGVSDASGLRLLKKSALDPLHANTFGTGELIRAALDKGAGRLILGVGGSATVDGATGLLKALGVCFYDKEENDIPDLPVGLLDLNTIDITGMDKRLSSCEITVLCDVQNKLLGHEGAARVFGPQKGAGKDDVLVLEKCLEQWNRITEDTIHFNMAALKYGGAAGGIAAGLAAYAGATLVSGIEFFLDEMHFDQALQQADLVITAEGSIDEQTLEGKGPYGIARRAKAKNIPVIGLAGYVPAETGEAMNFYFDKLISINPPDVSLEEAMKNTCNNLIRTARELGDQLAIESEAR